jgi:hypothetical protein
MAGREVRITLPRRKPFKNVYQFKIALRETRPPIWRQLQVPESYTFYDLHVAIQDAMGWLDYHLHMFEVEDKGAQAGVTRYESPFTEPDFAEEGLILSTEVPLRAFFKKPRNKALYSYDYGDGWQLDVILEKVLPKEPNRKYPICLAGELAGPPEDCGGITGYYQCLKALKKKDNSDGFLTWLGNWRPDCFNPKLIKFENPRSQLKIGLGE